MAPKTPSQQLQECKDSLGQLKTQLARSQGAEDELDNVRQELAQANLMLAEDNSLSGAERRRFAELLREAEAARDSWTQRAVRAENELREKTATLAEVRHFVEGKECILPELKHLLGIRS